MNGKLLKRDNPNFRLDDCPDFVISRVVKLLYRINVLGRVVYLLPDDPATWPLCQLDMTFHDFVSDKGKFAFGRFSCNWFGDDDGF